MIEYIRKAFYKFSALTKVVEDSRSRLIIELLPPFWWTLSVLLMALAFIVSILFSYEILWGLIILFISGSIFVFGYRTRFILDKNINRFTKARKSFIGLSKAVSGKTFALDEISEIYLQSKNDKSFKDFPQKQSTPIEVRTESTRIVIELKNSQIIPLQDHYSRYHRRQICIIKRIRKFLGFTATASVQQV